MNNGASPKQDPPVGPFPDSTEDEITDETPPENSEEYKVRQVDRMTAFAMWFVVGTASALVLAVLFRIVRVIAGF